jgi:hypothetical protein
VIQAKDLAAKAASKVRTPPVPYALGGRSDRGTDCINLVGWCAQELGGKPDDVPRGSNTAWRSVMEWTGTLDEARRTGKLIPGALVYICDAPTAQWPDGDYGHAGVYVGPQPGWTKDQVIAHAPASRGGVFPSTLKNAWTHAAWLKCVDYADRASSAKPAAPPVKSAEPVAPPTEPVEPAEPPSTPARPTRVVISASGDVNMRKTPSRSGFYMGRIPTGETVEVVGFRAGWYRVRYGPLTEWIDGAYAEPLREEWSDI